MTSDELYTPEIGAWAERKYRLVSNYANMFATSMKRKWQYRVYLDLFAGAGQARIRHAGRIVNTSPLLAMSVQDPFDRYVLCDLDPNCLRSLESRQARAHPDLEARFVLGDSNEEVSRILEQLPSATRPPSCLTFCLVDPFRIRNLSFETMRAIADSGPVDFLVLIPSHMDAHREQVLYSAGHHGSISRFIGNDDWRDRRFGEHGEFGTFVVQEFGRSMQRLGYIYEPGSEVMITRPGTKVKLYYLSFFSRHKLGMHLWTQARKYSDEQLDLF